MNNKLNVGNMDDVKWGPFTAAEEMQNDQQFSKDDFLNRPADSQFLFENCTANI